MLATALSVVACVMGPPSPVSTPAQVAALERTVVVDANGRTVSFLRGGREGARRVIYVHGTPGDATAWVDFLADPVGDTEAIALDRPGFGASAASGPVPSLKDQAAAIEPFLVEVGGKKPILVGHSLGGPIIARVAADYPDRVGGIVIVAGSLDPGLEKIMWMQHLGDTRVMRSVLPQFLVTTNDELLPLEAELRELQPLLAGVTCPVAIVHGTRDDLVPYSNVEFMQHAFPEGAIRRVDSIAGAGHFIPWEHAKAIRDAVQLLLDGKE